MSAPADALDWVLDRTVLPGYASIGYRLRGLEGSDPDPQGRLDGSRVLVTGANSGLGAAACEQFAARGAEVLMVVRDRDRGEQARARIAEATGSDNLHLRIADLADLDSVERLADELHGEIDSLDAVVHNAGALLQSRQRSPQGHELTFAVHVLGPFLLTHRLAPLLGEARNGQGRVIFVSSGGAYTARLDLGDLQLERRDFDGPEFYAHAKRAQIALLGELNRSLGPKVRVDAMHPGWARTPGVADSLPRFNRILGPLLRTPEQGADTIVWLAARSASPGDEGRLWMDRRTRPEHRVPWTAEEPGESALLYEACAELTELDAKSPWEQSHRGPAGAVRTLPSP